MEGDSKVSMFVRSTKECNKDDDDENDLSRFLIDLQISFCFLLRSSILSSIGSFVETTSYTRRPVVEITTASFSRSMSKTTTTSATRTEVQQVWQRSKILSTRYASGNSFSFLLPTSASLSLSASLLILGTRQFVLRVYVCLDSLYLSLSALFPCCNITTNQINAFMREKMFAVAQRTPLIFFFLRSSPFSSSTRDPQLIGPLTV